MICSCKGAHSLKHICPNGAKKYFFPSIENDARMLEEIKINHVRRKFFKKFEMLHSVRPDVHSPQLLNFSTEP